MKVRGLFGVKSRGLFHRNFHPITSKVNPDIILLRVHLKKGQIDKPSDVLVDQIRAIDNKRLIKKLGKLTKDQIQTLKMNLRVVLDI
jgi:mRNA interferase MazF